MLCLAGLCALSACESGGKKFKVKGDFVSADGKTLYFEKRDLAGIQMLDSAKLKEKGSFSFSASAPENPEFYQLRIDDQAAVFVVDSTETLQVKADADQFIQSFIVEESPVNDQIRQVNEQQHVVAQKIRELDAAHRGKEIDDLAYLNGVESTLATYKSFASKLILGNPSSAAAYYALFQKVDNYLIFDPYSRQDFSMFGAVGTSWNQFYPETPRTKHLYNFTMAALKSRRKQEQQEALLQNLPIQESNSLPDIELPDVRNEKIARSSLKGKVVVLDFTVYKSEFSPEHNLALNKIYAAQKSKGLEIYQISFDSDEHFWKNAALNVPWIAVRDPQTVYSSLLGLYNLRNLPTAFVLNRNGDVVARVEDFSKLQAELNKVL
jgi:peroxiredoxin